MLAVLVVLELVSALWTWPSLGLLAPCVTLATVAQWKIGLVLLVSHDDHDAQGFASEIGNLRDIHRGSVRGAMDYPFSLATR